MTSDPAFIPLFRPSIPNPERAAEAIAKVLASGYIGEGEVVREFERAVSMLALHSILATSSGTAALELAFRAVRRRDGYLRALVTPQTCIATAAPIVNIGGSIVWCDVDQKTGMISGETVARGLEDDRFRSRQPINCVVGVDWGGRLAPWAEIRRVVDDARPLGNRPVLIQDAAHSFGTAFSDDYSGDLICYSFQAIKQLTTGDGGGIAVRQFDPSDDDAKAVAKAIRLDRWFGLDREAGQSMRCDQKPSEIGGKYQMTNVAAALGLANLEGFARRSMRRKKIAEAFRAASCRFSDAVPHEPGFPKHAFWFFPLLIAGEAHLENDRDAFIAHARKHGFEAGEVHRRLDVMPGFRFAAENPRAWLPGVDAFSAAQVAIPCRAEMTDDEVERICGGLWRWRT